MTPTPGYSGTPLAQKLGYKHATRAFLLAAPADYRAMLAPLPEGVLFQKSLSKETDLVHLFATEEKELSKQLTALRKKLNPTAMVWVSWPKKSAKVETDITEDVIRKVALPMGWVDIKVCAVSEIWSGLKLVVRKELR